MKLYVSNSGIADPIQGDISETLSFLKKAAMIDVSCSKNVSEYNGIINLKNNINSIIKDVDALNNAAKSVDRSYEELTQDGVVSFNNVIPVKINERKSIKDVAEVGATIDTLDFNFQSTDTLKDRYVNL